MDKDTVLFEDKSLSDILAKIYNNSMNKNAQIDVFLVKLNNLINTPTDAALLIPLVKEFMDASIKNDDLLVKISNIIQKLIASQYTKTDGTVAFGFSDAEKEAWLKEIEEVQQESTNERLVNLKIPNETDSE